MVSRLASRAKSSKPFGVDRGLHHAPIEIRARVGPPDRAAFPKAALCRINRRAGPDFSILVPDFAGGCNSAPSRHQLMDQALPLGFRQRWIGLSPESAPHDEISAIRRCRISTMASDAPSNGRRVAPRRGVAAGAGSAAPPA